MAVSVENDVGSPPVNLQLSSRSSLYKWTVRQQLERLTCVALAAISESSGTKHFVALKLTYTRFVSVDIALGILPQKPLPSSLSTLCQQRYTT